MRVDASLGVDRCLVTRDPQTRRLTALVDRPIGDAELALYVDDFLRAEAVRLGQCPRCGADLRLTGGICYPCQGATS